ATWLTKARRHPITAPLNSTAKVCPVMGTGENGKGILICAQAAVTRLKAMTQIASVARFRPTGIWSIKTSVEARVINAPSEFVFTFQSGLACPRTFGIIAQVARFL